MCKKQTSSLYEYKGLGQGLTINKHRHVMMPLLANKSPPANPGAQEAAAAADGLIPDVLAPETSYCEPAPAPTRPRPHASPALAATSDFSGLTAPSDPVTGSCCGR